PGPAVGHDRPGPAGGRAGGQVAERHARQTPLVGPGTARSAKASTRNNSTGGPSGRHQHRTGGPEATPPGTDEGTVRSYQTQPAARVIEAVGWRGAGGGAPPGFPPAGRPPPPPRSP